MENNIAKRSSFWFNFFKNPQQKDTLSKVFSSNPIFSGLKLKDIDLIIKSMHNRVYQNGEYIFLQGDPGIGLYFITEGSVSIVVSTEKGEKYNLTELKQGDFFGELALLNDETRSASAIATCDTKISVFFKPDLDEYIDRNPKNGIVILRGICQVLSTRLKNMNNDFLELFLNSQQQNKES